MHANYSLEKDFKINKCIELFNIKPNFYDTNEYNYRNKVTLHIKDSKLGFYNEKTHDITAIDYCYLLNDKINNIIKELNIYLQNNMSKIEDRLLWRSFFFLLVKFILNMKKKLSQFIRI